MVRRDARRLGFQVEFWKTPAEASTSRALRRRAPDFRRSVRPALHRVRSNNQTFAQPLPLRASSLLPLCRRPGHYHKSRTGPGAISGGEQRPKSAGLRFELLCTPNARGGFSPKIHLRTNAKGDPLIFHVTSGEAHEVKGYDALMRLHEADPSKLLGDKP